MSGRFPGSGSKPQNPEKSGDHPPRPQRFAKAHHLTIRGSFQQIFRCRGQNGAPPNKGVRRFETNESSVGGRGISVPAGSLESGSHLFRVVELD